MTDTYKIKQLKVALTNCLCALDEEAAAADGFQRSGPGSAWHSVRAEAKRVLAETADDRKVLSR
jgi:hypothetical protein